MKKTHVYGKCYVSCQIIIEIFVRSTGEYFVVGINIVPYFLDRPEKYLKDIFNVEIEPVLQESYKNYLGIVPSPAQEFDEFSRKVNEYARKPPFNFGNVLAQTGNEKAFKKVSSSSYTTTECKS